MIDYKPITELNHVISLSDYGLPWIGNSKIEVRRVDDKA
jgi:hypothetical protein